MSAKKATLAQLQALAASGELEELKTVLTQCRFEELRKFLNEMGVRVRSKAYAEYRTKEDHVALLAEVLAKDTTTDAAAVVTVVTPVAKRMRLAEPSRKGRDAPAAGRKGKQSDCSTVACVDELLGTDASWDSKYAERARLVQCINTAEDALAKAERKEEAVRDLKRTLTCELAYYVKRLKRIQESDDDEKA
jgi:hypothetical protein